MYGPQNIDPKSVTLFDTLRHFRHILYKSITRLERDRNRDLHNNPVILVVYSALHAILNKILAVQIWKWNEFRITSEKAHLFIFIPFHRGMRSHPTVSCLSDYFRALRVMWACTLQDASRCLKTLFEGALRCLECEGALRHLRFLKAPQGVTNP